MAMTIGDAQDVQWVIDYLAGENRYVDRDKFNEALLRLADRSAKVLMAGETAHTLGPKLARLRLTPPRSRR